MVGYLKILYFTEYLSFLFFKNKYLLKQFANKGQLRRGYCFFYEKHSHYFKLSCYSTV
jgi:hypothetical protein